MTILLCKLALAPAFVVLVSMTARRFGPRIGGVVGGLPVVAGPILLVLALQEGDAFAADAARASVLSLVGLTAFVVLCSRTPANAPACGAVLLGWAVFLTVGAGVAAVDLALPLAVATSLIAFSAALRWGVPIAGPHGRSASRPPHDLLLRALTAALMVIAVTSVSDALGPAWSGVLAPFPTVTSVLAGFSLAHDPRAATQTLLRSMVIGFFSFAAFLTTVAATIEPWGTAPAFLSALAVAGVMQVAFIAVLSRRYSDRAHGSVDQRPADRPLTLRLPIHGRRHVSYDGDVSEPTPPKMHGELKDYRQPMVTSLGIILGFLLNFLAGWAASSEGTVIEDGADALIMATLAIASTMMLRVLYRILSPTVTDDDVHYRRTLQLYTTSIALAFVGFWLAVLW